MRHLYIILMIPVAMLHIATLHTMHPAAEERTVRSSEHTYTSHHLRCPTCRTRICIYCQRQHNPDHTCEDALRPDMLYDHEKELLEAARNNDVKCCPHCHAPAYQHHGQPIIRCNYCNRCFLWNIVDPPTQEQLLLQRPPQEADTVLVHDGTDQQSMDTCIPSFTTATLAACCSILGAILLYEMATLA